MPMQRQRKWHSHEGRSMKRQIMIGIVAATLSIATLALIFGMWWLVSFLVNTYVPHLMLSHAQANFSVLIIMMIIIAFLGGWLTSVFPMQQRLRPPKLRHARPHPHLHLHFRH